MSAVIYPPGLILTPEVIEYFKLIDDTSSFIVSGDKVQATIKFIEFIKKIKSIGSYNPIKWQEGLSRKIYDLGKLISEKSLTLLDDIKNEISISSPIELEILHFIESEIQINLWGYSDPRCAEYILTLSKKYVSNPEFIQDLGNLEDAKGNYLQAVNLYNQTLIIYPKNNIFIRNCFNNEIKYIDYLIEQERFEEAKTYITTCQKKGTYKDEAIYSNWLVSIYSRISDHELIRKTLALKEAQIETIMEKKFEKERFKAIELIGVFIAIIAFVFSTISFTKSFSISDALLTEITFGLILILFVISLSLIFQPKEKNFYKDTRFYSIIVLVITLIVIYFSKG